VELEKEIAGQKEENEEMTAKNEKEKAHIVGLKNMKEELDEARGELEAAQRNYEYNKVAEIQYSKIPALEEKLKNVELEVNEHHPRAPPTPPP
ncbi:hypothetical protein, partial [Clostridium sp. ZBS12]|uniref:hypothetical protein n=1 Tax=Clostridium sp. ZBS12 TaxID=2949972 RepID=UPI00207A8C1A